jgi:hypothetical protein
VSEATKAVALQHAVAIHGQIGDHAPILATAKALDAFMNSENPSGAAKVATPAAKPATPTTTTKAPAKVATPAKTAPKKAAPPADDDAPEADGPTKEEVGESVQAMLDADRRDEAVALFAEYGGKSLSTVPPENYAALKQALDDALLTG